MRVGRSLSFLDDTTLGIKTTHTATSALNSARVLRDMGKDKLTPKVESVPVAVVPPALIFHWAKKHGVRYDDPVAMREVVDRELADPANARFRVYGGSY